MQKVQPAHERLCVCCVTAEDPAEADDGQRRGLPRVPHPAGHGAVRGALPAAQQLQLRYRGSALAQEVGGCVSNVQPTVKKANVGFFSQRLLKR